VDVDSTRLSEAGGAQHVEHCMGTVFTIAVRDPGSWADAISDVVHWLHRVDALLSTYQSDSEVSRIRRGELAIDDAEPLVREAVELCKQYEAETGGYFTADLPGGLDPSGLVKGWAIERASDLLREHGSHNHAVNGGGDMQLAGEAAPGRAWCVGIADPHARDRVLATVTGRDCAVATYGTSERGEHNVHPHTGVAAHQVASVTVVGPSLTRADAYATASCAMGPRAADWLESMPGHDGLVVLADGRERPTSRFGQPFAARSFGPGMGAAG
jgi:thiamine biosynthesis lipoprotein